MENITEENFLAAGFEKIEKTCDVFVSVTRFFQKDGSSVASNGFCSERILIRKSFTKAGANPEPTA